MSHEDLRPSEMALRMKKLETEEAQQMVALVDGMTEP